MASKKAIELNKKAWGYARAVISGEVPACQLVIQQCQKALDRLEAFKVGEGELTFDIDKATKPSVFASMFCRHLKGPLAGQPIELEPWQLFTISQIYGWLRPDGYRVVRTVYYEVPRKNGKSTLCSVLGLFHLFADKEQGAEVYSAAKTREQARIVFGDAQAMVRGSKTLSDSLGVHRSNIHHTQTNSKFEPLASDAGSLEGKNPSFSIVDEVHTHQTASVWDVLAIASGARSQPIQFGITTAGTDRDGIAFQLRDYLIKTIEGQVEDDSFWGLIYTIDEGDQWDSPESFQKANPNYGKSVQPDDMERLAKQSAESPSAKVNFMTKRLNVWQSASSAWLNMQSWDKCGEAERPPLESWKGQNCYIGLDLASTSDFTCVSLMFSKEGKVYVYNKNFLPEDAVYEKAGHYGRMYQGWLEEGLIEITEGNVVDLRYIKQYILDCCERFNVKEIGFDPWGSSELSADLLDKGLPMVKIGQGMSSLSGPSKAFEVLVRSGKLIHGNDPILSWMASNCEAFTDVNENIKIRKPNVSSKIDGVIAAIMALSRLDLNGGLKESVYESRGIRVL